MINLLDIHIANLIAAGEVVDRPSSALKELVENSIDANASVITIEIKNGGIAYMRVTDNGDGMNAEDLGRAILRHATSKITSEQDLFKIKTLGFRGEALAAISSVSDLKIFTKVKGAPNGYMLEASSGQNTKISEAGCADGTTVIIERLFSKIPARQKFLKRDITEGMYCKWIVEKIALSNPSASFRFIHEGKQKIFTPGNGNYKDTVYSVFGGKIAENLIAVGDFHRHHHHAGDGVPDVPQDAESIEIEICGFISRIEDGQKTRVNENFFVNGRYVYSKTIMSAVEDAYKSISETRTFPICALYIKIDESKVDINVHPQKTEIKFSEERKIYSAVYYAVKDALDNSGSLYNSPAFANDLSHPASAEENEKKADAGHAEVAVPQIPIYDVLAESPVERHAGVVVPYTAAPDYQSKYFDFTAPQINEEYHVSEKIYDFKEEKPVNSNYKIIGEAFYGYIFIEKSGEEKLIVIDKHAAHERIIYDIISKNPAEQNIPGSQILLEPAEIKLAPMEITGILDIEKDLKKLGVIFEWQDEETVLITEVPFEIADVSITEIIKEAAYLKADGEEAASTVFERLAMLSAKKSAACRAAMKSGMTDSIENIAWLVDRVINYSDVKYCPHGRPVAFEITKNDIEKQFKR
jgi:DNA mismatch repair protein MutL